MYPIKYTVSSGLVRFAVCRWWFLDRSINLVTIFAFEIELNSNTPVCSWYIAPIPRFSWWVQFNRIYRFNPLQNNSLEVVTYL